jgi:hypothetical protein
MIKICAGFSGIMLVTPLQSGGWRYDIVDDLNIYWTIYSTGNLLGQSKAIQAPKRRCVSY